MKVLMVNGSPHEFGCTYTALAEGKKVFEAQGIEAEIFWLGAKPMGGCTACGMCAGKGACVFEDAVNEIGAKIEEFDAMIVGSPVHYAGPSTQTTAFMDRFFYVYGGKMAGKLGAAFVSCRRGGASAAYDRIHKYYGITNMPIVTSQYWNQIHGNKPEEALQDEEGLQTMRTLAMNTAWLLKCIEAGKAAGITLPTYEAKIKTNYIR